MRQALLATIFAFIAPMAHAGESDSSMCAVVSKMGETAMVARLNGLSPQQAADQQSQILTRTLAHIKGDFNQRKTLAKLLGEIAEMQVQAAYTVKVKGVANPVAAFKEAALLDCLNKLY